MTEIIEKHETATTTAIKREIAWKTVVWNDPINTMTFVVYVFKRVLQFPPEEAERKMMEVHQQGKSTVFSGDKEKAEYFAHQLQGFGLQATLEQ